jgi:hypothetical protein
MHFKRLQVVEVRCFLVSCRWQHKWTWFGSSPCHFPCSRNGKPIYAPEYFMEALPTSICLDGELFAGRQEFQSLMSTKSNPDDPRWAQVCYLVYDAPLVKGSFTVRLQALQDALDLARVPSNIAKALEQVRHVHLLLFTSTMTGEMSALLTILIVSAQSRLFARVKLMSRSASSTF